MKISKGFTLIELLVVIAIIGILSSVVLVSLNTARGKGNFAKVQAQMNAARVAAENYYSTAGSYGTAGTSCTAGMFADSGSGMSTYSGTTNYPSGTSIQCTTTTAGAAYAMMATYTGVSPTQYACIDSRGNSVSTTTALTSNVTAGYCQ